MTAAIRQAAHPVTTPHEQAVNDVDSSFFRQGNYQPVPDELSAQDLTVTGSIPRELNGWYLRNGPNPRAESGHWFSGEGMLHGVRLERGGASWYRNRWIRNRTFAEGGGGVYQAGGVRELSYGTSNTHVVTHAGRTLALVETSLPYEVDRDLNTIGPYDFAGRLTDSMTAHPKICPTTGELHFFGYGNMKQPHVTYHRADASGRLIVEQPVDVPGLTMMHDFALTGTHVIFMDLPVVFDRNLVGSGTMPYRWSDTYRARLGVMRRDDPTAPMRWVDLDPCYVFHTANAYDDGRKIVMHVLRYPSFWRGDDHSAAALWRWTIDLEKNRVEETQLDERPCEFPRIDDRLTGSRARFAHVTQGAASSGTAKSIIRYDLDGDTSAQHVFGAGRTPGEAVFVPSDTVGESQGWLLTYVYDQATDRSELVVLDSSDLRREPVARVHLPARVPYGFHGNWLPDEHAQP